MCFALFSNFCPRGFPRPEFGFSSSPALDIVCSLFGKKIRYASMRINCTHFTVNNTFARAMFIIWSIFALIPIASIFRREKIIPHQMTLLKCDFTRIPMSSQSVLSNTWFFFLTVMRSTFGLVNAVSFGGQFGIWLSQLFFNSANADVPFHGTNNGCQ